MQLYKMIGEYCSGQTLSCTEILKAKVFSKPKVPLFHWRGGKIDIMIIHRFSLIGHLMEMIGHLMEMIGHLMEMIGHLMEMIGEFVVLTVVLDD